MMHDLQVRASAAPWWDGVNLLVIQKSHGKTGVGRTIVMHDVPLGQTVEPTCHIDNDAAQALMDDLWNCGIRPTEGAGTAGAMKAAQDNLKDLREETVHLRSFVHKCLPAIHDNPSNSPAQAGE